MLSAGRWVVPRLLSCCCRAACFASSAAAAAAGCRRSWCSVTPSGSSWRKCWGPLGCGCRGRTYSPGEPTAAAAAATALALLLLAIATSNGHSGSCSSHGCSIWCPRVGGRSPHRAAHVGTQLSREQHPLPACPSLPLPHAAVVPAAMASSCLSHSRRRCCLRGTACRLASCNSMQSFGCALAAGGQAAVWVGRGAGKRQVAGWCLIWRMLTWRDNSSRLPDEPGLGHSVSPNWAAKLRQHR